MGMREVFTKTSACPFPKELIFWKKTDFSRYLYIPWRLNEEGKENEDEEDKEKKEEAREEEKEEEEEEVFTKFLLVSNLPVIFKITENTIIYRIDQWRQTIQVTPSTRIFVHWRDFPFFELPNNYFHCSVQFACLDR